MRTDRGFTLLEVLVAFVIAAAALVVLFRGALEGVQGTRIANQYEEAVSRARSHLASVRGSAAVAPVDQQGDDGGGFHWHVRVSPAASVPIEQGDTGSAGAHAVLYAVVVTISWPAGGGSREVRLEGARIGLAPPAPP